MTKARTFPAGSKGELLLSHVVNKIAYMVLILERRMKVPKRWRTAAVLWPMKTFSQRSFKLRAPKKPSGCCIRDFPTKVSERLLEIIPER